MMGDNNLIELLKLAAGRGPMSEEEIQAQRESWVRGMAPCQHGVRDFEECPDCRGWTKPTEETK